MNINHSPAPWSIQDHGEIHDAGRNMIFSAYLPGSAPRSYMAVAERATNLILAKFIPEMLGALLAEREIDAMLEESDGPIPLELTARAREMRESVLDSIYAELASARGGIQ